MILSQEEGESLRLEETIIWSSENRVYGECLGVKRRRRPWQAAKSLGEEHTSCDPEIAEWGNPAGVIPSSGS